MPAFEALLLDMDGVVIDSEPLHDDAQRAVFAEFDLDVPDSIFPSLRGMREREAFELIIREYADGVADVDALLAAKERIYRELTQNLNPVPGALAFIKNARKSYRLALTTSSMRADLQIAFTKFDLARYFDAVVTAEDIVHPKPHPQPYLATAAKLGLNPPACVVIEDSVHGVRSAARAGCRVAGLTTSFDRDALARAGAHLIFDTFDELARHLNVSMGAPN